MAWHGMAVRLPMQGVNETEATVALGAGQWRGRKSQFHPCI
jgi:hypothetical protein